MSSDHGRRRARPARAVAICLIGLLVAVALMLLPGVAAAGSGVIPSVGAQSLARVTVSRGVAAHRVARTDLNSPPDLMALLALQQAELTGSDSTTGDLFGYSVAVSGDTALVGAYGKEGQGATAYGAAYVFTRSNGIWRQQAELTPTPASPWDTPWDFGNAVALDGNTALVAAYQDNYIPTDTSPSEMQRGAVYVFVRSGVIWTQQAELTASDGVTNDQFGSAVALCGDASNLTAVIGAKLERLDDR